MHAYLHKQRRRLPRLATAVLLIALLAAAAAAAAAAPSANTTTSSSSSAASLLKDVVALLSSAASRLREAANATTPAPPADAAGKLPPRLLPAAGNRALPSAPSVPSLPVFTTFGLGNLSSAASTNASNSSSSSSALAAIARTDLPLVRPPAPPVLCDYSCMTDFALKVGPAASQGGGVFSYGLWYKPIRGVTSKMMAWMWGNLASNATSPRDGKQWPVYLLFHGIDHLYHTAVPSDPVRVGTTFVWCEIPLHGCSWDRSSARAPWSCPRNRTGFLRSDPPAAWAGLLHTKVSMTVSEFNMGETSGSITFHARETNAAFGPSDSPARTRTVATTRHSWQDGKAGLWLHTSQRLGLMQAGSTTAFDTSLGAAVANEVIWSRYLGGARNVPNNVTAAAWHGALHYLQEYGTLGQWLPGVYALATATQAAEGGAAPEAAAAAAAVGR